MLLFIVSLDADEPEFMFDEPLVVFDELFIEPLVVPDELFVDPLPDVPWFDIPVELEEPEVVALEVLPDGVVLAFEVVGIVGLAGVAVEAVPVFEVPVPGAAPPALCATERPVPRASVAAAARVSRGESFLMMSVPVARSKSDRMCPIGMLATGAALD